MTDTTDDDALVEGAVRAGIEILHGPIKEGEEPCRLCIKAFRAALAVAVPMVRERGREEVLQRLENPDEAMQIAALNVQLPDFGEPPLWHKIAIALAAAIRAQEGEG
jgi:hypothetical protein